MFGTRESSGEKSIDAARALENIDGALSDFQTHLRFFEQDLNGVEKFKNSLFADTSPWKDLLAHKLLPHLLNRSCLIVVFAGGTSSGKSTLFNLLLQEKISLVKSTSAATRVPVLAVNPDRLEAARNNCLLPDFNCMPGDLSAQDEGEQYPPGTVFVASSHRLPRSIAFLDTPDYDSVEETNWEVAEKVRAAGDILLAVVTPIKYIDEETIAFFKEARNSGRIVIPLLNKVEKDQDPTITRQQIQAFAQGAALPETLSFVVPKDYSLEEIPPYTVMDMEGKTSLLDYLSSLDIGETKMKVYRQSLESFLSGAGTFIDHCDRIKGSLLAFLEETRAEAHEHANRLSPAHEHSFAGILRLYAQKDRNPLFTTLAQIRDLLSGPIHYLKARVFNDKASPVSQKHLVKLEAQEESQCTDAVDKQMHQLSENYKLWLRRKIQGNEFQPFFEEASWQETGKAPQEERSESWRCETPATKDSFKDFAAEVWRDCPRVNRVLKMIDRFYILSFWTIPPVFFLFGFIKAWYILVPVVALQWILLYVRQFCEGRLETQILNRGSVSFQKAREAFEVALYATIAEPQIKPLQESVRAFESEHYTNLRSCHRECLDSLQRS